MGSTILNSFDTLNSQAQSQGSLIRLIASRISANTTAATITSGSILANRSPDTFTVPSLGASVGGAYCSYCALVTDNAPEITIAAIEYSLGTLTVSGNSFAAGVSMPTKTVRGTSIQTASTILAVVITATLTAANPVLTITYADQDGNTGATATLTLPTNSTINTVFYVNPHLANGDTGAQSVSNISISAGSAGTLKVYGLLPLAIAPQANTQVCIDSLTIPLIPWILVAGDVIAFYHFGSNGLSDTLAVLALQPDTV